jgi:hypothetical protein
LIGRTITNFSEKKPLYQKKKFLKKASIKTLKNAFFELRSK